MRSPRGRTAAKGDYGFTLIELTVVLAVIVTLALILTPAVTNYLNDSRVARTRSDVQTIASAILQFNRDTGFFPQWSGAGTAGGPGTQANKVDLLVSSGNIPPSAQTTVWVTGTTDLLSDQLLSNAPGYTMKGVAAQFGWSGPYLNSAMLADAWGNRYMVNVGLLESTAGPVTATGAVKNAVWVVCAGANGAIETTYAQPVTTAVTGGDDIAVRVQ